MSPLAIRDLLDAAGRCVDRPLPVDTLLDLDQASAQARRFKLDVSFALTAGDTPTARVSVNDKGEALAFRDRLRAAAPRLGVPESDLRRHFGISPPGEAQTTVGVKWGARAATPERVTLYYEELSRCPRAGEIRRACFDEIGAAAPPERPGCDLVSVGVDWAGGRVFAAKDYWMSTDRMGEPPGPIPESLEAFRAPFGFHPVNRTRRFLVATRHALGGAVRGAKLLWMSEVHRREDLPWAWGEVDRLRAERPALAGPVAEALDALRSGWRHGPDTFLYPDLVSLDVDADGRPQGLLVYVSIR